jgi:hypothetical protein
VRGSIPLAVRTAYSLGSDCVEGRVCRLTGPPGALSKLSSPSAAAVPPTPASTLRRRWLDCAFRNAEIDASHWDPTRGVDVNRRTIERVYDYYGRLYLDHARLEWAGMANMIGPSFYAGFLDIGFFPDQTRRLLEDMRHLVTACRRRVERLFRRDRQIEEILVGDLGFFETTFLTMQRKIFEDQALMHEAYVDSGLDAIRALGLAGIIAAQRFARGSGSTAATQRRCKRETARSSSGNSTTSSTGSTSTCASTRHPRGAFSRTY